RRLDGLAVVGEVAPSVIGDGIELLVAVRLRGDVARLFKPGQRRIDDSRAGRIEALRLLIDGLDDVVAVTGLLLDEVERDEAQVAAGEHPTDTEAAAQIVPVGKSAAATPFTGHGFHPAPAALPAMIMIMHAMCLRYIIHAGQMGATVSTCKRQPKIYLRY